MSEFGEPWRSSGRWIISDDGQPIVEIGNYYSLPLHDRIIACVNACASIPTEALDRARQFMTALAGNFTPEQKAKLLEELSKAGPCEVVALPDEVEYRPAPLAWRKDPPTSAPSVGYDCYWVLAPNGARFVVKVEKNLTGGVLIYRFGETIPSTVERYAGYQWAGPIEPPPLPS